ncbi:hypothetical protein LLE49_11325 [Alicyclobacillus tolerans]|uniref:hypothetical protein n=1 Tax=Alicyclobacillus tolerans TaxID=90970 RepID=UPI001F45ABF4|nr:hypothetical protein [Alicyclobacillus tolerans]MCF8565307.1 hypothetical protein [Alicyclobacillus tolerans]
MTKEHLDGPALHPVTEHSASVGPGPKNPVIAHSILEKVGKLPGAFIAVAFVNFTVGALLGGLMALNPNWISDILPIHVELNPYGWLTMMIYGMTYAVLGLSAGLKPPFPVVGWIQLVAAELGIAAITVAAGTHLGAVLLLGWVLQTLAPALFMFNILSAVAAKRKKRAANEVGASGEVSDAANPVEPESRPQSSLPQSKEGLLATKSGRAAWVLNPAQTVLQRLFGPSTAAAETDKVAQRGTDISLMLFLAGVFIALWNVFDSTLNFPYSEPAAVTILVDYGWIAGTVLSVALHLYPRLAGFSVSSRTQAQIGQGLWLLGVVTAAAGVHFSNWAFDLGIRILGIAFIWTAGSFLWVMPRAFPSLSDPTGLLWWVGWGFALVLGVHLAMGLTPLSALALHLLFLGWITSLVYGIGYAFFPVLFGRRPPSTLVPLLQAAASTVGVILMALSFGLLDAGAGSHWALPLLAIGGSLALIGAWAFLLQWPLAKKQPGALG